MNNPIDHDQAFTDSKFRELLHGPDNVPNIYAAYLDLRKTLDSKQKEIESLQAQLREQHQNQLDLMEKNYELEKQLRLIALEEYEKPPVEPEEVYSPHTEVLK